jgi:hypothetical protein
VPVQDVPRLSRLLAAALGDWVAQVSAVPQAAPARAEVTRLSVRRRLRLNPALLRLRQRRAGGVSAR